MGSLTDPRQWKAEAHDLFQSQAELYANEREHQQGFRAQLAIVMRALAQERGKVLDIGCAAGSIIQALRARDFEVVGIDFSSKMLAFASQRFGENPGVRLCRADVEFLPFSAESFDDVTCLGILEYLPDYHRAVAEIARILRPGGLAIFSIPSRISPYHLGDCLAEAVAGPPLRFMKHLLGRVATMEEGGKHHRNLCVPWKFRTLLRACGFEPEQSTYSNFFVFPLDRIWPNANVRLASFLERFRDSWPLGWTASQYLVAARKRAV